MDKELAQYINTLLAEKEREVKSKQDYLDKIDGMPVELIDTVTGERTNLDPEKQECHLALVALMQKPAAGTTSAKMR